MKNIIQYITEKYNDYRVKNLKVPYIVNQKNDYMVFKIPEIWSEDDFQIYLQDRYFDEMPGSEDNAEDFFGVNSNNIYDVVFNYDKYEKSLETNEKDIIDYDINYDNKISENDKFCYIRLDKFRYIINFDEFDLKDENIEDIHQTLIEIFKRCESNDKNEWPLEITLDEENIEYK